MAESSCSSQKQILVVAPAWVGDMVLAQSLFKLLKARNPDLSIDILAPDWTLSLAKKMPEVRRAIHLPFNHGELKLLKRYLFAKKLRATGYDQAIILPCSWKAALIPFWANIPIRTGWLGEWRYGLLNDIRVLKKINLPLMIQRFVALGLARDEEIPHQLEAYYPALTINPTKREVLLLKYKLSTKSKILAICPGAEYGPAKRWPYEHFIELSNQMLMKGWQIWIFGSKKDLPLAENIMTGTKNNCHNLAGKTSLVEAIDLLSLTQGVICNDSGLMHIGAALNIPTVALFGSSSPGFTPPLSKKVSIVYLGVGCSPCFKRSCPLGHFQCLQNIRPERVFMEFERLIQDRFK
jgi:heptosyltransferase II